MAIIDAREQFKQESEGSTEEMTAAKQAIEYLKEHDPLFLELMFLKMLSERPAGAHKLNDDIFPWEKPGAEKEMSLEEIMTDIMEGKWDGA